MRLGPPNAMREKDEEKRAKKITADGKCGDDQTFPNPTRLKMG